jgi:hypothetical protein
MSPMQQIFLGLGAVATKTYVDDLFSTYVYEGNNSTLAINNGLDLATEGGMIWVKNRDSAKDHCIVDTERGIGKRLETNKADAQDVYVTTKNISSFTSTGFTLGVDEGHDEFNKNGDDYASWSFRKAPGFFDVVTWTGNNTARTIAHSLGSVPGCILIKCTSAGFNWMVYHRGANGGVNPADYGLRFNDTNAQTDNSAYFNDTLPTSTHFTIGTNAQVNANGSTYVAYVFAGGESTAATARSVDFNGSGNLLTIADNAAWDLGNGDFTLETWIKSTQTTSGYFTALGQWSSGSSNSWGIRYASQDVGTGWSFFYSTNGSNYTTTMGSDISDGQWHHIAVTRTGGKLRTFTDGLLNTTRSTTDTFFNGTTLMKIGGQGSAGNYFDGQLSNLRLVKGTAVYTSSFRPPTEPLTNITNTVLLMCNNSSYTGSTVTPSEIVNMGDATASTDSPFDDPAAHIFGESGSESVIKMGSYVGAGAAENHVNVGFEPQWVMVKCTSNAANWRMFDSMRGIVSGENDTHLQANTDQVENVNFDQIDLTPTGFKLQLNGNNTNGGGLSYVYVAIRRSDGYVGKPPELGSSVFTPVYGSANAPLFKTPNHDVDFHFAKDWNVVKDWNVSARLIQGQRLETNTNIAEDPNQYQVGDYSRGWGSYTGGDGSRIGYNFKRHAGFDVVTYTGNQVSRTVNHSLNAVPEMIWSKDRTDSGDWIVYHKGLNGGTNPATKFLYLNKSDAENGWVVPWNNTEPTSVWYPVQASTTFNKTGNNYLTMLFASVDGISKVDGYDGDTNAQDKTISCGFQPRFVIAKCSTVGGSYNHWFVFDSVRGAGSGNDKTLRLDVDEAQTTNSDIIEFNSNGFIVKAGYQLNEGSRKYIYYAHS